MGTKERSEQGRLWAPRRLQLIRGKSSPLFIVASPPSHKSQGGESTGPARQPPLGRFYRKVCHVPIIERCRQHWPEPPISLCSQILWPDLRHALGLQLKRPGIEWAGPSGSFLMCLEQGLEWLKDGIQLGLSALGPTHDVSLWLGFLTAWRLCSKTEHLAGSI